MNVIKRWFSRPYRWISVGSLVFLFRFIISFFPSVIEQWYSRGVFIFIRQGFDFFTNRLPFPLFFPLTILFLGWMIFHAVLWVRLWRKGLGFTKKVLLAKLNFLFIFGISFLVLWGFNYARLPLEQQLNLTVQPLDLQDIIQETKWATQAMNRARAEISNADTSALEASFLPENIEDTVRFLLEKTLVEYGFPTNGKVRVKLIYPKGLLYRLGISGIYLPWIGEGSVESSLLPPQLPFTLAHEMAHGYGFADEASCNFWAYLACKKASNPVIRYAAALSYWRYIASEYKYYRPEEYEVFRTNTLSRGVFNDLELIYNNRDKYPSFIPFQNEAYDVFLKFQGLEEGIESYNQVVGLVRALRNKH